MTRHNDPLAADGHGDSGRLPALVWIAIGCVPSWCCLLVLFFAPQLGDDLFIVLLSLPVLILVWPGLLCIPVRTFVTAGGRRVGRLTFFFFFLGINTLAWLVIAGGLFVLFAMIQGVSF